MRVTGSFQLMTGGQLTARNFARRWHHGVNEQAECENISWWQAGAWPSLRWLVLLIASGCSSGNPQATAGTTAPGSTSVSASARRRELDHAVRPTVVRRRQVPGTAGAVPEKFPDAVPLPPKLPWSRSRTPAAKPSRSISPTRATDLRPGWRHQTEAGGRAVQAVGGVQQAR